jgi:hypothetical protein
MGNSRSFSPWTMRTGSLHSASRCCACQMGGTRRESDEGSRGDGSVAKRGEGLAENEAMGGDPIDGCYRHAAAQREAEHRHGQSGASFSSAAKAAIASSSNCSQCGPAGAFAVAGVVKDQRGDAVGGEKLLHAEPLLHGFANAMTKQNRGPRGNGTGSTKTASRT